MTSSTHPLSPARTLDLVQYAPAVLALSRNRPALTTVFRALSLVGSGAPLCTGSSPRSIVL